VVAEWVVVAGSAGGVGDMVAESVVAVAEGVPFAGVFEIYS
jgi:hypothetical protein